MYQYAHFDACESSLVQAIYQRRQSLLHTEPIRFGEFLIARRIAESTQNGGKHQSSPFRRSPWFAMPLVKPS